MSAHAFFFGKCPLPTALPKAWTWVAMLYHVTLTTGDWTSGENLKLILSVYHLVSDQGYLAWKFELMDIEIIVSCWWVPDS